MKLGYVELADDSRYADRGAHSGIVFTDLGRPYQGSQVALENARAIGRVIGVEFSMEKSTAASGDELVQQISDRVTSGGVHFVLHAAGWLESALLASYEKFIIDVEALRMFEWILSRGIPFDDEGFAMDGIREVGPGGHHLGSEHTMRHYRTGFYRPWISSTENFDRWQRNGSRTADRVANEKWKQLLKDYADPGIDSGVDEQLQAFIEVRKDAILHARV